MALGVTIFDGVGDRLNFTGGAFDPSGAISVAALLRPNTPSGSSDYVLTGPSGAFGLTHFNSAGSCILRATVNGWTTIASSSPSAAPQIGEAAICGFTKAAGSAKPRFHKKGVHADSATTLAAGTAVSGLEIGAASLDPGFEFTGDIAFVALWNRALTDAEWDSMWSWADVLALAPVHAIDLSQAAPAVTNSGAALVYGSTTGNPTHSDTPPYLGVWDDPASVIVRLDPAVATIQRPPANTYPTIDTGRARRDGRSWKYHLDSGENDSGGVGARVESTFVRPRFGEGSEIYARYAIYLPAALTVQTGKWSTLWQWRDGAAVGSPSVEGGLVYDGGIGILRISSFNGTDPTGTGSGSLAIWEAPATRDVWHDIVVHGYLHSDAALGWLEVAYAADLAPLARATLKNGGLRMSCRTVQAGDSHYFKEGVYRDPTYGAAWDVWHDPALISTATADVGWPSVVAGVRRTLLGVG